MQLASKLPISCNIQHLAQKSQHKLQWSMLRKRTFRHLLPADMANRQSVQPNDIIKWMKARAAWRQKESERWGHCAAWDPKEACSAETTRNTLLKQWRNRKMDWGLCWERDRWGRKASWRRRGCGSARAGRYGECWNLGIDVQRARKDFWGDDGCYGRQSEWYCKFRRSGGWWRWGWRDRAGIAEQRWWTQLGDEHNLQNSTAAHGEHSGEADEAWCIDTTGMGGCSRLLPQMR